MTMFSAAPEREEALADRRRVCRASHDGVWVAGELRGGACHVSLLRNVKRVQRFQVLQSAAGGARLSWRHWDKFKGPLPTGAVSAAQKSFVVRRQVDGVDMLGKLDPDDGMGRITLVDQVSKFSKNVSILFFYEHWQ